MDSQSVKGADTVGAGSRGYDAGKRINGRKRHIVVDTTGLLLVVLVTAASVQDRDGGRRVLDRAKMAMPSLALVFADGGYAVEGETPSWTSRRKSDPSMTSNKNAKQAGRPGTLALRPRPPIGATS